MNLTSEQILHKQGWRNLKNLYLSTDNWLQKSTCPCQGTTCPYTNKYQGKICQDNDLMNAL